MIDCRAYVHIHKDKRSKLDNKTKECIFLGYGHEEFGYWLWDPVARKLIRSQDVVFLEDHIVFPPVVYNDHGGARNDNNDGLVEPID